MKRLLVLLLAAGLTLCGGCAARIDEAAPDLPPAQPVQEAPAEEKTPAAEEPEAPAEEAPAPEAEPQVPAAQGETALFRLGEEEKELAPGDSLGGWTLESLDIQRQEDGSIQMVTAEFSGEEQLEGTLSPSGLLEGEWDFFPTEADAARLPRYAGEDAAPAGSRALLTQWDQGLEPPRQGEQPCRLTVSRYREVFAYRTAPSSVQVSAVQWQ